MHILYINVLAQQERRSFLEDNLASCAPAHWQIERIDATTPQAITPGGLLTPNEIACYHSHQKAIARASELGTHAMIIEDDALFAPQSCALIEGAVQGQSPDAWDVLFTDVAVTDPAAMLSLFQFRQQLRAKNAMHVIDLRELPFCASAAYVINPRSAQKLARLAEHNPEQLPFDLMLRKAVNDNRLKAQVLFPFVTSLSKFADASQIQPETSQCADLIWNAFRRLIWIGQDTEQALKALLQLPETFRDDEAVAIGNILSAYLSQGFVNK